MCAVQFQIMKYFLILSAFAFSACASKTVLQSGTMYYWGVAVAGNTGYITPMRTASCKYLEDCAALSADLEETFKQRWEWQKFDGQTINRASVFSNTWSRESAVKEYAESKQMYPKPISF